MNEVIRSFFAKRAIALLVDYFDPVKLRKRMKTEDDPTEFYEWLVNAVLNQMEADGQPIFAYIGEVPELIAEVAPEVVQEFVKE
jgi:hypothetical protein